MASSGLSRLSCREPYKKELGKINDSQSFSKSFSRPACRDRRIIHEAAWRAKTSGAELRHPKDVPILRVDHAAGAAFLSGVWQVASKFHVIPWLQGKN